MIAANKVVSMKYVLKDEDGDVLDASEDEPLEFLHGHQNIIPGLERELEGLKVGDKKQVKVKPEDGYGTYDPERQIVMPRTQFGDAPPETGMMVQLRSPDGQELQAVVAKVGPQEVWLDGNHPLAGKTLFFDVEITAVRDASKDEVAHGHPHGPDGHGHHH